ncbi:MAG: MgtC/SapB family protein [Oricola sp.]|jgi:putative Mg2+ transporter-C (MgtC) family protein|nr:MgtC/SapB family protein [Oricola sp.]
MQDLLASAFSTTTPFWQIFLRMFTACVFGFAIGFDREYRGRPAGLRTNMLTALAASVFAIIAIEMIHALGEEGERTQLDPIRVVEAVTAGVAFLAAGTIIQSRGSVKGLTTGAGMWLSGAVGLACGAGFLAVGFIATVLAIIILIPLDKVEERLPRRDRKEPPEEKPTPPL